MLNNRRSNKRNNGDNNNNNDNNHSNVPSLHNGNNNNNVGKKQKQQKQRNNNNKLLSSWHDQALNNDCCRGGIGRIVIILNVLFLFCVAVFTILFFLSNVSSLLGYTTFSSIFPYLFGNANSNFNIKNTGPSAKELVLRGRTTYAEVPEEYRRTFYMHPKTKFRRTVVRAFRNRGWRKSDEIETAHFIWDKGGVFSTYKSLLPWQRYDFIPGYNAWDAKDGFINGFQKYRFMQLSRHHQNSNDPQNKNNKKKKQDFYDPLYMIPETYRLTDSKDREAFEKRLYQDGGLDLPWVLKNPNSANGKGITMLGPNSKELRNVLKDEEGEEMEEEESKNKKRKKDQKVSSEEEEDEEKKKEHQSLIQAYICNELTWWGNKKFDLRFYWMVASVDPLIVLYHDGYVRVGNGEYDESDWSSTRQHLTTHTFLAAEEKGTVDNLKDVLKEHHSSKSLSRKSRKKIQQLTRGDPYLHVRNQMKQSIAETVAAFYYDTFGQSLKQQELMTPHHHRNRNNNMQQSTLQPPENVFALYGADFVIDNDLDVWYVEAQNGPGLEEEFDFRVEMHRELIRGTIDMVEEIQMKLQDDPTKNVLPLKSQAEGWDIVYAGNTDEPPEQHWMFRYKDYTRFKKKKGCNIKTTNKENTSSIRRAKVQ